MDDLSALPDDLGLIAFVVDPVAHTLLIGFAGRDVAMHLARLQAAAPRPLLLLATMPGTQADLHQFDALFARAAGGWFVWTPALWSFLAQHTQTTRAFRRMARPNR